jgi:hypothetical protein
MSWHFLQEGVAASWQHTCLDGAPFALLNLIPVQDKSSLTDSVTGYLSNSRSGMTCGRSTGTFGVDMSMLLQEGFLAKTSAGVELGQDLAVQGLDCGRSRKESFAKFDPSSLSWKTPQCSLLEDSEQSLETWPGWGSMQSGECSELQPLERLTIEHEFTWLLTPTAQSWKAWTFRNPLKLIRKNHADGNLQEQLMRLYQRMITPRCQEILMMWPEGWTGSKPLAMDGFRQWQQEQCGFC